MEIYYGNLEIISTPEVRISNRTLDYGNGFYTTTSYDQAEKWVLRHKKDKEKPNKGYVNVYEIDIELVKEDKNTLWFDKATEEWVDFVYSNRNDKQFIHNYNFVYGPVANDKVYAAFSLFESGFIDKQTLIKELRTYTLVDQLLFHTPESLSKLVFKEAKEILS